MSTYRHAAAALIAAAALSMTMTAPATAQSSARPITTVDGVHEGVLDGANDGVWYQIAATPSMDLVNCFGNVTMTYTTSAKNEVTLERNCTSITGQHSTDTTHLTVLDEGYNTRFAAHEADQPAGTKLTHALRWRTEEDGKLMLFGTADGTQLAVYSRTPAIDSVRWQREVAHALQGEGVSPCLTLATPQPGGAPVLPVCVLR